MSLDNLRKALKNSQIKGDMYNRERAFRSEAKHLGVAANKAVNTRKDGEALRGLMRQNQYTNALKGAIKDEENRLSKHVGGIGAFRGQASTAIGNGSSNRAVLRKFSEHKGAYSLSQKAKNARG